MLSNEEMYDVVIVGAGVAGAIVAKQLADAGKSVLVLEAGPNTGLEPNGFEQFIERYYTEAIKIPNAPFKHAKAAPAPSVLESHVSDPDNDTNYMFQKGPIPYSSNYTRLSGGTTLHWLGTSIRMLPSDFKTCTLYGVGKDWPISYAELEKYYQYAEWELGVSADVAEQKQVGSWFGDGYDYPMEQIPTSYLDKTLKSKLDGLTYDINGEKFSVDIVATPAARNSIPRNANDPRSPSTGLANYRPIGALFNTDEQGNRCIGNSSCVPICPAQAKYTALKTLNSAINSERGKVDIVSQAVASKVIYRAENGVVTDIRYKKYDSIDSSNFIEQTAKGRVFVIAAHAIETAKLLLASNAANSSDLVGRNLMDHPTLLTWGLMPHSIGSFRGPGSTSGIPNFRDGKFRSTSAAFRIEIGNWGWSWPRLAPTRNVTELVDKRIIGKDLRNKLGEELPKQFRFALLMEQLPDPCNRVSIDPGLRDLIGNHRPVINYDIGNYCKEGLGIARKLSRKLFAEAGASDETLYETNGRNFEIDGQNLTWEGPGHAAGTHRMGCKASDSVVDHNQRTWDHQNLYLVGAGSFCTIGTANPTLTIAALAFKSAESIVGDLSI